MIAQQDARIAQLEATQQIGTLPGDVARLILDQPEPTVPQLHGEIDQLVHGQSRLDKLEDAMHNLEAAIRQLMHDMGQLRAGLGALGQYRRPEPAPASPEEPA
ncbi:MAG: hypothetical protein LBJ69_02825 [Holosporales bacterium]|nr:hypothetical protein [Holosporales bacterium]